MKTRDIHPRLRPLVTAFLRTSLALAATFTLCQCAHGPKPEEHTDVVVSVKDQKLAIYKRDGSIQKEYPISTSKFGVGDKPGTYGTPLGMHEVVAKIGHGAPSGAVFKSRSWTGEVIKPDSPGRDPIVSRIMWLRGMEKENKNAYGRCIYIHGTAEERNVGKPVSYGCIRMKSRDVIDLFNRLPIGSRVLVSENDIPPTVPVLPVAAPVKPEPGTQPPIFLEPKEHPGEPLMLAEADQKAPTKSKARKREDKEAPESKPSARVAENASFRGQPSNSRPAPPEEEPPATPPITRQQLPGGGTVLYTAPTGTGPGLVLKSKRTASQGYQQN